MVSDHSRPGQQFIDLGHRLSLNDFREHVSQIALEFDIIELSVVDGGGDGHPGCATLVGVGK